MIAITCRICKHAITRGRERVRMQARESGPVCDACEKRRKRKLKMERRVRRLSA